MAQRYELLYLVSTQVTETDLPAITEKVAKFITEHGGTVAHDALWARRKLTYPIGRNRSAYYWLVQYESPSQLNAELTSFLNLETDILRSLITDAVAEADSVRSEEFAAKTAAREEPATDVASPSVPKPVVPQPTPEPVTPVAPKQPVRTTDEITAQPKETTDAAPAKPESVDLAELDRKLGELLDDNLDNT